MTHAQKELHNQAQDVNAEQILQYLEEVLTRQVNKLRQYDLDGALRLAEESEKITAQVNAAGLLEDPAHAEQRDRIRGLYEEIRLVIHSEQNAVTDKLDQIRTAIRALGKYAQK